MVHLGMILHGFQMSGDLCRHFQVKSQSFLEQRRQSMSFAHAHHLRKQKMHLYDLSISCRAEANSMVFQSQFRAYSIEPISNLMTDPGI